MNSTNYKNIGLFLGPIAFFTLLYFPTEIVSAEVDKVIAAAAWMIIWWITEAVSIFITGLLPIVLFPLLGIMSIKEVCPKYASYIIYLLFGGFVIGLAIEKVQLHKRFALNILKLTGTSANGIVLGFMLASVLMSMWISNVATAVIMLPIAVSVIDLIMKEEKKHSSGKKNRYEKQYHNFALSVMLGIAYSANVGGVATIIGTPPNVYMLGYVQENYNIDIDFLSWFTLGFPFSALMFLIIYFIIVYVFYPNKLGKLKLSRDLIRDELKKLGRINKEEKIVIFIFLITVTLWMSQTIIKKWVPVLGNTTIAMIGAFAMLIAPSNLRKREFIMEWEDMSRFPWGIIIMYGGGIALGSALAKVGLIAMIAEFVSVQDWSAFASIIFIAIIVLFATELMSNTALITIVMPLLAGTATGLDAPLLYIIIPATIAASCAFILPISTPPNAVVYSSGRIKIHEMARIGIVLNIITILVLMILAKFVIPMIF